MKSGSDYGEIQIAAASWDVRLRSHACTEDDRAAFRAWRDADFRHGDTFDRLQSAVGTLRQASDEPRLRALRERAALMTRHSSNRRVTVRLAIAAAIAIVAVGIATLLRPYLLNHPTVEAYVTDLKERRTIALPDGSSVTLNAGTRLETSWLPHERRVRLVSGQVLFRVSRDPLRPFVVTAGDRTVTALGTEFDVRLDADEVRVTLLEGRVAIRGVGHASDQPTLELTPNQQLIAIDGATPTVRVVDVTRSTGWAEGQVFFDDTALPAAVAEMNRYSSQQIVVGDPGLARYRINGMFRSGNQEGFVGAVTSYYPIDARNDAHGRIVLVPRREGSQQN